MNGTSRELKKLTGYGDTVRLGDIIQDSTRGTGSGSYKALDWGQPVRVFLILEDSDGVTLGCRAVDEGPLECKYSGLCTFRLSGPGWTRVLRVCTPEEVCAYHESLSELGDGWHGLERVVMAQFRTTGGIPVEIRRETTGRCWAGNIKFLAEVAGRMTGYDLALTGRYSDTNKLSMLVKHAVKRKPPKVPRRRQRVVGKLVLPSRDALYAMAMARSEMILKGQTD